MILTNTERRSVFATTWLTRGVLGRRPGSTGPTGGDRDTRYGASSRDRAGPPHPASGAVGM